MGELPSAWRKRCLALLAWPCLATAAPVPQLETVTVVGKIEQPLALLQLQQLRDSMRFVVVGVVAEFGRVELQVVAVEQVFECGVCCRTVAILHIALRHAAIRSCRRSYSP